MSTALDQSYAYKLTYNDYLNLPDDGKRKELIDGKLFLMASPSHRHQEVLGELFSILHAFLRDKKCKSFMAPYDVRLPIYNENDGDVINVVQPDIVIYCNKNNVDEKGGKSAPEIIIEILSPSTAKTDRITKYRLYEAAKVKEYWIVDIDNEFIEIHVHNGIKFVSPVHYLGEDTIKTPVLDSFAVKASQIFPETFTSA